MTKSPFNGIYRLRFQVFQRDNFTCQYCGRSAPDVILHVDHKVPVAEGGDDSLDNLITACSACNVGKGQLLPGFRQEETAKPKLGKAASSQRIVFDTLSKVEGVDYRDIARRADMDRHLVSKTLTLLKRKKLVFNKGGLWYINHED